MSSKLYIKRSAIVGLWVFWMSVMSKLSIFSLKKQNLVLGPFFSLGRKVKTRVRMKHV